MSELQEQLAKVMSLLREKKDDYVEYNDALHMVEWIRRELHQVELKEKRG